MRKILLAIAGAGFMYLAIGCNQQAASTGGNTPEEERNLAASRTITKAFQTGDASSIDSVLADDFLDHTDRGDFRGKDSLKSMIKWVNDNMKDQKVEAVREVAEGDYVWSWMRYTGTSNGAMGMPKGPYDMQAIELAKFKDGKAVEHWSFMETQSMMKMMAPMMNMNNMSQPSMDKMPADSNAVNK